MGAQGVVHHQRPRNLAGQRVRQASAHVDGRQLVQFRHWVFVEFGALARQVGLLGVGLRMHRHVLAGGHRHRASGQAGHAGHDDAAVAGVGRRHAHDQAGGGNDAVVGTENRSTQPSDARDAMAFDVAPGGAFHRALRDGSREDATTAASVPAWSAGSSTVAWKSKLSQSKAA